MRVLRRALWALLLIGALAPAAASAAGTVTLDSKPDIIPFDAATVIKVTYSGACQDMIQDSSAGQSPAKIQIATESTASGTPNPWLQISSTGMDWGTQDQIT